MLHISFLLYVVSILREAVLLLKIQDASKINWGMKELCLILNCQP